MNELTIELIPVINNLLESLRGIRLHQVTIFNIEFSYKELYLVDFELLSEEKIEIAVKEIRDRDIPVILRIFFKDGEWFDHDYSFWEEL